MATIQRKSDKGSLNLREISRGDLTWVDIIDPAENAVEARQYLTEHYNFHPMDLDDCFSRGLLPKVDEYQQYVFIVFQYLMYDKTAKTSATRHWAAFVGDKYLVTLHPATFAAPDELRAECESSEEAKSEYMGHGSGFLLYQILDRALDSYLPVLDKINDLLDDLEGSVFDEEVEVAKEIGFLRRNIASQRRVMMPTRALLVELEGKLKRFSQIDLSIYWGDLTDHINKICDTLDEYRETIEVFKDADYVLSGGRANRAIRMVALMLAVALPFLVITGLWLLISRMVEGGNNLAPVLLLALILATIGGMLYLFRRKRVI